jgi:cell division initiation protein
MKIGPVDIRNQTFKKKMSGVDDEEVQTFLDLVADRLEEEILSSEELRGKIDRLQIRLEEYESLERSLRNSLVSAEQLASERVGSAEKEARIIIKNAEVDAEKIVLAARGELSRLRAELDDLRRQKITYVERFRALLRSQAKILEASIQTFDPDHAESTTEPLEGPGSARAKRRGTAERPVASPPGSRRADVERASSELDAGALASYLGEEGLFANMDVSEKPGREED